MNLNTPSSLLSHAIRIGGKTDKRQKRKDINLNKPPSNRHFPVTRYFVSEINTSFAIMYEHTCIPPSTIFNRVFREYLKGINAFSGFINVPKNVGIVIRWEWVARSLSLAIRSSEVSLFALRVCTSREGSIDSTLLRGRYSLENVQSLFECVPLQCMARLNHDSHKISSVNN